MTFKIVNVLSSELYSLRLVRNYISQKGVYNLSLLINKNKLEVRTLKLTQKITINSAFTFRGRNDSSTTAAAIRDLINIKF